MKTKTYDPKLTENYTVAQIINGEHLKSRKTLLEKIVEFIFKLGHAASVTIKS